MTFSKMVQVPTNITAYPQETLDGEQTLQISIGGAYAQLPVAEAQALADYINEKFPRP